MSYVYAIGRGALPNCRGKGICPGYRTDTLPENRSTDLHAVLSKRENRLVRQLCWVLTIQGLETYLLQPRDPADIDLLIKPSVLHPAPMTSSRSVVRHIAPPEMQ
jgi:hypothetical protein